MKKFFKNREEARKFRRELVVPLLVEAGIFCIESFIADSLIPGYVQINREKLQTRRGKATFIAGCVVSYPALLGFNLMATEKLSKPINDMLDDLELDREAKKIARLYVKGFTAAEIAKALDMDEADVAFAIETAEAKYKEAMKKADSMAEKKAEELKAKYDEADAKAE